MNAALGQATIDESKRLTDSSNDAMMRWSPRAGYRADAGNKHVRQRCAAEDISKTAGRTKTAADRANSEAAKLLEVFNKAKTTLSGQLRADLRDVRRR